MKGEWGEDSIPCSVMSLEIHLYLVHTVFTLITNVICVKMQNSNNNKNLSMNHNSVFLGHH